MSWLVYACLLIVMGGSFGMLTLIFGPLNHHKPMVK